MAPRLVVPRRSDGEHALALAARLRGDEHGARGGGGRGERGRGPALVRDGHDQPVVGRRELDLERVPGGDVRARRGRGGDRGAGAGRVLARPAAGEEDGLPVAERVAEHVAQRRRPGRGRDLPRQRRLRGDHLLHDPRRARAELGLVRLIDRCVHPRVIPDARPAHLAHVRGRGPCREDDRAAPSSRPCTRACPTPSARLNELGWSESLDPARPPGRALNEQGAVSGHFARATVGTRPGTTARTPKRVRSPLALAAPRARTEWSIPSPAPRPAAHRACVAVRACARRPARGRRHRRAALPRRRRLDARRVPRRRPLLLPQRLPDHVAAARRAARHRPDRPARVLAAPRPPAAARGVPRHRASRSPRRRSSCPATWRRRAATRSPRCSTSTTGTSCSSASPTSPPSSARRCCATCGRCRSRSSSTSCGRWPSGSAWPGSARGGPRSPRSAAALLSALLMGVLFTAAATRHGSTTGRTRTPSACCSARTLAFVWPLGRFQPPRRPSALAVLDITAGVALVALILAMVTWHDYDALVYRGGIARSRSPRSC